MWCCFNATTAIEPTKIVQKPLKPVAAEVPVAQKPVTLMFRLPSQEAIEEQEQEEQVEVEEVVPVDDTCGNPCTILLAITVIGLLYSLMLESERVEL